MYTAVSRSVELAIGRANPVAFSEGGSEKENGGPEKVSGPLFLRAGQVGQARWRALRTDLDDVRCRDLSA